MTTCTINSNLNVGVVQNCWALSPTRTNCNSVEQSCELMPKHAADGTSETAEGLGESIQHE